MKRWFMNRRWFVKIGILILVVGLVWFGYTRVKGTKSQQAQYQTAQVERGTLIVSVAASGQASTVNNAQVTTAASGVVKKVHVTNGQRVSVGTPVAELELDLDGRQRSTQAYASYQSAKNSLDTARANLFSLQSDMLTNWKTYMDVAQRSQFENSDKSPKTSERQLPEFMVPNDDWLATEAKYKNQQNVIVQAQTSVSSSWLSYQQVSPVIYAPISGTVTGLSLQVGSVLTAQSNSSGGATSQKIASIRTDALPTVIVNLTQIDVPKVHIGDKATLTFDAFAGKTFTGKIVSIDTFGSVSSGVTTYPAVIALDSEASEVLPNMSAQANIITQVKDNVLSVSTSAVGTNNGESFVRVLKNGQPQEISVETGILSTTHIEITSGLSEGDTVVTNSISQTQSSGGSGNQTRSPFSSFGGGGGGFRIAR